MCIFCRIVAKEIPATIVYEDDQVLAFRDIKPQAPVHILVIPKVHTVSWQDTPAAMIAACAIAIQKIAVAEAIVDSGYRVVSNCGANAGQEVGHVHFHVLAGRALAWPPG